MLIRYVGALALDIYPVDKADIHVEPDADPFEVADVELAGSLLDQVDNFQPADDEAEALLAARTAVDAAVDTAEDMTVAELLPLLAGMTVGELEEVQAAETAGKGRKTVLDRITELLAVGPSDTTVEA